MGTTPLRAIGYDLSTPGVIRFTSQDGEHTDLTPEQLAVHLILMVTGNYMRRDSQAGELWHIPEQLAQEAADEHRSTWGESS